MSQPEIRNLEISDLEVETLEILADQDLMSAFHQGIADIDAGRVTPLEQVLQGQGETIT